MKSLLYLIGYRGTGKTTVGRLLAERSGRRFIDADVVLETNAGRSIREIFADEGEAGFRDKETAVLQELSTLRECVVAAGGGVILRETNRDVLHRSGDVVWLKASSACIWRRIQADGTTAERRPNLMHGGLAEVEQLLAVRENLYRTCADFEIDVTDLSPSEAADAILIAWESSTFRSLKSFG